MKLSFDQKLTFASSDLPLAMDWKISTNNPFKITLFSSSRQEMIVFDKQLALIAQYKFQFPFPLDVVKLSSQNTFLAWYSQAREFIEFHYPDYIIRKIRIPVEVLKNNLLRDIFELNGSFLLVQMEQILQVDFTGNLNTFFITPSDRVYVQDNTIIITTPYRINHFDKANEKLTYVVVLPNGKEWISNGKVAASYDNQILTVYTIPTKD
ncbi:MAG: hypothetical protein N2Z72_02010 [Bacteroidales bacterium]|nr:hypothetical protein [Bacteroidales bacterium]